MSKTNGIIALLLLLIPASVLAHDDAYFDSHASPHGGQVRMAGPYHLELVVTEQDIRVYVTDHADEPQDVSGMRARMSILSGGKRTNADLVPDAPSLLVGKVQVDKQPETLFVLALHTDAGAAHMARFTPWSKPEATHAE